MELPKLAESEHVPLPPPLQWLYLQPCFLPRNQPNAECIRCNLYSKIDSICTTTREHLQGSLLDAWDYADPIAGVSLHLEPREDRRHAYQWHMPSGDPTRSNCGGMIGANRLALEAWPLFQSLPAGEKLTTVGFRGTRANDTSFTWPIWNVSIGLESLRSLLALKLLQSSTIDLQDTSGLGIAIVYRCSRILVGKTPNLTSSMPVAVG